MSLPFGGRKRRGIRRMWGKCITLKLKNSPSPVCLVSRVCVRCTDVRLFCTDPAPLQLCPACFAFRLVKCFCVFVQLVGKLSSDWYSKGATVFLTFRNTVNWRNESSVFWKGFLISYHCGSYLQLWLSLL